MSITWGHIKPGADDPIRGEPTEFEIVEQGFRAMAMATATLGDDFLSISGFSPAFSGQAASQFQEKMRQLVTPLNDVPSICRQIEDVFRHHGAELRRLQREADNALARAQTHWTASENAQDDHVAVARRSRLIDQQLDSLEAQGPAADPAERARLLREQSENDEWASDVRSAVSRASAGLKTAAIEWQQLRDDEERLEDQTCGRLRSMELWSLGDPSLFEQVKNAIGDLVQMGLDFANYICSADFLEDLYELISVVLTVLSFVSLVLAFIPGLQAVAAVVAIVSAVLAVVKAVLCLALVADGRKNWGDFAWDAVGAVVSVAGAAFTVAKTSATITKEGATSLSRYGVGVGGMQKVYQVAEKTASTPFVQWASRHGNVTRAVTDGATYFDGFLADGWDWAAGEGFGLVGETYREVSSGNFFRPKLHAGGSKDGFRSGLSFDPWPRLPLLSPFPVVLVPTGWN